MYSNPFSTLRSSKEGRGRQIIYGYVPCRSPIPWVSLMFSNWPQPHHLPKFIDVVIGGLHLLLGINWPKRIEKRKHAKRKKAVNKLFTFDCVLSHLLSLKWCYGSRQQDQPDLFYHGLILIQTPIKLSKIKLKLLHQVKISCH